MSASPERVAARHMNRARAKVLMDKLDGADIRWNRDWWVVLEELAAGEQPHADHYNYAFHAMKNDIVRATNADLPPDVIIAITELRDTFAAALPKSYHT